MTRLSRLTLATMFLFVAMPMSLLAQTAQVGVLAGVAKDATGAILPGVSVEAKHQEKGFTRTAVTESNGTFRMAAMPLGPYTVTGTLSGFELAAARNNVVEAERTTEVTLTMKLGAATDTITVTGEVPIVDRTNVAAKTSLRAAEFQKLPVGRNYQSLIGLAPGVAGTAGGNVNAHGR